MDSYKVTGRYTSPNSHGSVMSPVATGLSLADAKRVLLAAVQSGAWYDLTITPN